jgi:hypothetical protein
MESRNRICKSIYLDWNVFQDLIQERKSVRLTENLEAAKNKRFIAPYSYAHMSDLARCGNPDYVQSDLQHVEKIADSKYIDILSDCSNVRVEKVPPKIILDEVRLHNRGSPTLPDSLKDFPRYKVAIKKIPEGNLIIPYLNKFDGYMCHELINLLMIDLIEKGLDDYNLQRDFRNSFIEIVKIGNPSSVGLLQTPIFKYLLASKTEIEENFIEILDYFLGITKKSIDTIDEREKFTTSYGILDFFPVFKEKLNKRNNMNNMLTDALHVFIASKCSMLVCGDDGLVDKAKLLYRIFKSPTKVYHVKTFIERVEF